MSIRSFDRYSNTISSSGKHWQGAKRMDSNLLSTLRKLRMSGLASTLEIRLHEAATSGLNHREFLELLLQDELLLRNDRLIARRVAMAGFRDLKRLEDFDFSYNTSIKKS